jgi:archaellum biogenesis ATPase FlaH
MHKLTASTDAERFLIGSVLRDGLPFPKDLIPSDFVEPKHQEIVASILSLEGESITADELTVSMRLRDMKATTEAHYVSDTTSCVGATPFNPAWADEVRRLSVLRHIRTTATKAAEIAADPAADPQAILAFTEGQFKAANRQDAAKSPSVAMGLDDLLAFDRKNDPNSVIGNRWLCKGGSLLLVSQSGVGKSSFSLQFMVTLATKRLGGFFGIEAKRPLRVVFCQNENDFGDVGEALQDITDGLMLHPPEMEALRENLHIYRLKGATGQDFLDEMRRLIKLHAADVFVCDPLMAFAAINVTDQQEVTNFFRNGIDAVLSESGAVLVAVHHTTKPRSSKDTAGQTSADLAYSGGGHSEITNYMREVAVLTRCQGDDPIFKFSLTKRRGRSGMKDDAGFFAGDIYVRHCPTRGVIRWERSTPPDDPNAKGDSRPAKGSPRAFER